MFNLFNIKRLLCDHEYKYLETTTNNSIETYHFICVKCGKEISIKGPDIEFYCLKLTEDYYKNFNRYNCSFPSLSDEEVINLLKITNERYILIKDILEAKYGNGLARKVALELKGYDYNEIQNDVNMFISLKYARGNISFKCNGIIGTYHCKLPNILYHAYNYFKCKYKINIFDIPDNIKYSPEQLNELKYLANKYNIESLKGEYNLNYRLYMIDYYKSIFEESKVYYFINYNGDTFHISSNEIYDIQFGLERKLKIYNLKNNTSYSIYDLEEFNYKKYFENKYGFDIISEIENFDTDLVYIRTYAGRK